MIRVILSGGLDSTTALAVAIDAHGAKKVTGVTFDYGQRHAQELVAARKVAAFYEIGHFIGPLTYLSGSSLLYDGAVPEGSYDDPSMQATVVQGRNLLFAATAVAQAKPGDVVVFGVHAGDHPIYPDCRPQFWDRLRDLVSDAYGVLIETPFLRLDKAGIVLTGTRLGAPYELTWSCYKGGAAHCGRCGTCVERAEAFSLAGVADPTRYDDPDYWKTVVA